MVLQMGNKGFEKAETFSLSLLSYWSEKELLFLNGFEIRFSLSLAFLPVHLSFLYACLCSSFSHFGSVWRHQNEWAMKMYAKPEKESEPEKKSFKTQNFP